MRLGCGEMGCAWAFPFWTLVGQRRQGWADAVHVPSLPGALLPVSGTKRPPAVCPRGIQAAPSLRAFHPSFPLLNVCLLASPVALGRSRRLPPSTNRGGRLSAASLGGACGSPAPPRSPGPPA